MTCPRCSASNTELSRFCSQCGFVLDPHLTPAMEYLKSSVRDEVASALKARLEDQNVVDTATTEKVVNRLVQRVKIVGIPLALLAVRLSAWGIHDMSDADTKIKQATQEAVAGIGKKTDDATNKIVADLNARVTGETNKIVKNAGADAKATVESAVQETTRGLAKQAKNAQDEFDRLRSQEEAIRANAAALSQDINRIKPQIATFNERLGNVEGTVAGLVKAVQCESVADMEECHTKYPTGCTPSGKYDAYLNSLKNMTPSVESVPSHFFSLAELAGLDSKVPSTVTMTNHEAHKALLTSLGEGHIEGIIGYLYRASIAGAESTNCQLTGEANVDFMLSVGFDKDVAARISPDKPLSGEATRVAEKSSIIAEVTPYYRSKYHSSWTINKFSSVLGRQVKVVGQLLMDSGHFRPSDDCSLPSASQSRCWRASVWELHPVTEFYVCTSDQACAVEDSHWVKLEGIPEPRR